MQPEKTLIFTDLDGTLLDHHTYKTDAAHSTIKQLKTADIPIILNTSKTTAELLVIREQLALDTPFIIENGAAVFIPKHTFEKQPLNTITIDGYWVKEFSSPRKHWLTLLDKNTAEFKEQYKGFSSLSVAELSEITGLNLEEAKRAKQRQYGEPIQWLGNEKSKEKFIALLLFLGASVVQGGRFIHINGHCNKGEALTWLTEQYNINNQNTRFNTIALGDGENDIAMLKAADIAIQIRSPVHDFPYISNQKNVIQTNKFGPEGWAEALQTLLFTPQKEVIHG